MLSRQDIDKRLSALVPEHGFSHTTDWSLVDREREALETAKQLAEWGAMALMDCHDCPEAHGEMTCDHEMPYPCFVAKDKFEAWLEGRDE